jgi:hypothetical protein
MDSFNITIIGAGMSAGQPGGRTGKGSAKETAGGAEGQGVWPARDLEVRVCPDGLQQRLRGLEFL